MLTIELNEQFKQALKIMESSSDNVFITGKAGTGKSTLLQYFRDHTKKQIVVLAPTGVAAVNIKGQTIHSFFGFKPDITLQKVKMAYPGKIKIYKKLDAIVIDEISMVRADLLDCVDKFLQLNGPNKNQSFGGIQMIFIGDLYQLPPIVTSEEKNIFKNNYKSEYFFDAKVFYKEQKSLFHAKEFTMKFIELEKIYRQKDENFINLLNGIRNNSITQNELIDINKRYFPNYQEKVGDFYVYLTPTNKASQIINEQKLSELKTENFSYEGITDGKFEDKYLPTEKILNFKKGAQIMLLNNDKRGRWVNGTIGKIIDIKKRGKKNFDLIKVKLETGETVEVEPYTWEIFNFYLNERANRIESKTIGSFTQYPMKLAWSVTIHKSQGKTFNKVIIDIGRGTFCHGQMYVALSRCTTLNGIILKKEIAKKHIWMDFRVVKFVTQFQYQISEKNLSLDDKIKIIKQAIVNKNKLNITYLKSNDIKSKRAILPKKIGQMKYLEKSFLGIEAYCFERKENRVFRVDRILELC
ncbi:MAG: AAA family ATPase [Candidatus Kuenenbacteria bacterium]